MRKRHDPLDVPMWVVDSLPPAGQFWWSMAVLWRFARWCIRGVFGSR